MSAITVASLRAGATIHEADADVIRLRHAIIVGDGVLQEREYLKRAVVADTLASQLRQRGVDRRTARLLGGIGTAVLAVAYEVWIDGPTWDGHFGELVDDTLARLGSTVATPAPGSRSWTDPGAG